MAAPKMNIIYVVSPANVMVSADLLCEQTYILVIFTDSKGINTLVVAMFAQGFFDLYRDYIAAAAEIPFGMLPADVQSWVTQYACNPLNFSVYA